MTNAVLAVTTGSPDISAAWLLLLVPAGVGLGVLANWLQNKFRKRGR